MFFRYVGDQESKPMKSAAQLSLVGTTYMAKSHGNDDISGIGENASSTSIAPLPVTLVPSMDDVGCTAALVEAWLWSSPLLLRFHPPGSLPSPTAASVPRTYMCCVQKHALTWTGGCASLPACRGEDATVPQLPLFRVGPICRAYQPVSSEKGTRGEREAHAH